MPCLRTVKRVGGHLQRRGLLGIDEDDVDPDVPEDPENHLAASAVSGRTPAAGPQWMNGLAPLEWDALGYDKPLCDRATLDESTPLFYLRSRLRAERPWRESKRASPSVHQSCLSATAGSVRAASRPGR